MRLLSILIFLFLCSACTTTEVIPSKEETTKTKIYDNQTIAINAQEEYKDLQIQREKE